MTDGESPAYVLRLSPSRVDKFHLCPARWGYSELPGGTPEPGTPATDFGTATHLQHELRYRHGTPYDLNTPEGQTAAAMAPHLPRALPPYGAPELELTYEAEPGLVLVGRLDLTWPYHAHPSAVGAGKLTVCVTDYKTTGDSFRYAKIERDALLGHPQAPFYGLLAMRHFGTDTAFLHWVYAQRAPLVMPPGGWPKLNTAISDHYISRDEATERVHLRMVPAAKEMQAIHAAGVTAADAGTLPKNLRACRAFNRLCPFYIQCNPKKAQDIMEQPNAFLLGLGMSTAAPAAPAAPPPAAAAPVAPAAPAAAATPSQDTPPAVNPPEGATGAGKGKGKSAAKPGNVPAMTEADIGALADAVVDRLALRLMRNVP